MIDFKIGKSTKKYKHNKSYHINTTANFGSFQPMLCEFLSPNDTAIMGDYRQLVRNGVMPSPTFGDIKCINNFYFVKISDVYPAFDAFVSGQIISTKVNKSYVPTKIPFISNKILVTLLFNKLFSNAQFWEKGSDKKFVLKNPSLTNYKSLFTMIDYNAERDILIDESAKSLLGVIYDSSDSYTDMGFSSTSSFNLSAADFVISDISENKNLGNFVFGFRLNNRGRRLFKIFKGLGYSLDPMSSNELSILPILAYYKAWFDNYYPTREKNWQSTICYKLIREIYDNNIVNIVTETDSDDDRIIKLFFRFLMEELSQCFYVYSDNFYSAHFTNINGNVRSIGVENQLSNNSINGTSPAGSVSTLSGKSQIPIINTTGAAFLTDVAIQTLSRLTKFVNKNSLIGSRVNEYIRNHFGSAVSDSMFGVTYNAATFQTDVKLDDMIATADTASALGTGEHLGSRAGVGQGYSNNSFKYDAPTHGYLIGMMAIYPVSQFTQGDDGQLYMLSRFSVPVPEFDALGYELTPLGMVLDGNGISTGTRKQVYSKSFGFVPRYSAYKYKKSILNGDMALRSTFESYKAFHLENYIMENQIVEKVDSSNNKYEFTYKMYDVPVGGENWRKLLYYPQLGYHNRIFMNEGIIDDSSPFQSSTQSIYDMFAHYDDEVVLDDNFTVQCACDFFVMNRLKPIGMSFNTYDEDVDNDTTSVNNV